MIASTSPQLSTVVLLIMCLTRIPEGQATAAITNFTRDVINANYVTCVKRICEHYFHAEHAMKGSLIIMSVTADATPFQSRLVGSWGEDAAHRFSVMVKNPRKVHQNASHVSEKVRLSNLT